MTTPELPDLSLNMEWLGETDDGDDVMVYTKPKSGPSVVEDRGVVRRRAKVSANKKNVNSDDLELLLNALGQAVRWDVTSEEFHYINQTHPCLLYTSPSPRD